MSMEDSVRMSSGREFQISGPALQKALSPKVLHLVLGISNTFESDDLNCLEGV